MVRTVPALTLISTTSNLDLPVFLACVLTTVWGKLFKHDMSSALKIIQLKIAISDLVKNLNRDK